MRAVSAITTIHDRKSAWLLCRAPLLVGVLFILAGFTFPARSQDTNRTNFDGPAELPRVYLHSSVADTPAPGKTHVVNAGANLEEALQQTSCGDTVALEAGATFTGKFLLPTKNCDDAHWIVIRTSSPDTDLPPEGSRLTPCYAGIASLPGRPDFHCGETKNVLAKLVFDAKAGQGPILFAAGANHYRLEGLEITRAESPNMITALVAPVVRQSADHIVLDRVWVHGTPQGETTRGVFLAGMTNVAIVDSFFSDFHCVAGTGACGDSQAIAGGNGDVQGGPYKIVNNFLEASGENILFGGGAATTTPADIEIRQNYFFKPLIWKPEQPGFVGGTSGKPFIVKNLFELKNAQRVLFEGNLLENTWGGVGQTGYAILLTPKNQAPNVCPQCRVTDITIRFCKVSHMASALNIANALSDTGGPAAAGERYSIHDVIFDDIDGATYKGFGAFAVVLSNQPQLRDVKIDHVTAFAPHVFMSVMGNREGTLPSNFSVTNSVFSAGELEINSAGGGQKNCAFGLVQLGAEAILKSCFNPLVFKNNVIIGAKGAWPKGNPSAKDPEAVGFVQFNNGVNGDYHLCAAKTGSCKQVSRYLHTGTDGKDPGADVDAVNTAMRAAENGHE